MFRLKTLHQSQTSSNYVYDVFICHASEDKEEIARPLAEALAKKLRVWYDEFELKLGDSLRRKIDYGLANSRYGVVILSHSFFSKQWPKTELDGLVARDDGKQKVILPVWHHVNKEDVVEFSPPLADKLAARTQDGLDVVVRKIWEAMSSQPSVFEEAVNLEAERRLLRFSLAQLSEVLHGYEEAHKSFLRSAPKEQQVKEARRLIDLEQTVDSMSIETISEIMENVRESIEAIDELYRSLSDEIDWEGTHQG